MTGPYGRAAWSYRQAGWAGVLPLPPKAKWPPPGGFTGWAGVDPSSADVQAWCDGPEAAGNIALRLPPGTYGLDVDAYVGKDGAAALRELEARLGPLADTWTITSRDDGISGIRLYRADLPPGRRWRDEPAGHGRGVEALHFGHRYAVTWPSVHPETGRVYVCRRPAGQVGTTWVPRLDELPRLPGVWVEGLSEPGEVATGETASHAATLEAVEAFPAGDACEAVREARERARERLREARDGAALHPAGRDATHELTRLGHEGHPGARRALAEHFGAFVAVREARGGSRGAAEGEWWRLVRGAVGKLARPPRASCDCALRAGAGVTFDLAELGVAAEPGGDDAADEPPGVEGGAVDLADALIARMLTPAELRRLPPPAPLVEGLLMLDSASWLIAEPGSFKSFVALDWAGHIGNGKPWMGRAVTHGPVVYLVAEGVAGMGPRIRAWEQRHGPMSPEVRFLPMPVQVKREEHWAALVEACRRLAPVLVVLDTQARITLGMQENDNSEMGEFVEAVDRLKRATGACVLVVHHLGRSGQHARGASAIDGAQDTELRLTRTGDRRAVLEVDKSKNAADDVRVELEMFLCELDGGGASLVVGAPLAPVAVKPWDEDPADRKARILRVLDEQFSENGATATQVLSILRERGWTADYPKTTFYRWWNELQREGKIERIHGTQRWILAEPAMEACGS